uniref:Uncharacterized protein n=1 Tax=Arundo donax TaxID=35708 RepID=A0A0A9H9E9_ARUDO
MPSCSALECARALTAMAACRLCAAPSHQAKHCQSHPHPAAHRQAPRRPFCRAPRHPELSPGCQRQGKIFLPELHRLRAAIKADAPPLTAALHSIPSLLPPFPISQLKFLLNPSSSVLIGSSPIRPPPSISPPAQHRPQLLHGVGQDDYSWSGNARCPTLYIFSGDPPREICHRVALRRGETKAGHSDSRRQVPEQGAAAGQVHNP